MGQPSSLDRLTRMAERFKRYFRNQGLAETSFIASAQFRGFPSEMVRSVASIFWPDGPSMRFATPEGIDPEQVVQ